MSNNAFHTIKNKFKRLSSSCNIIFTACIFLFLMPLNSFFHNVLKISSFISLSILLVLSVYLSNIIVNKTMPLKKLFAKINAVKYLTEFILFIIFFYLIIVSIFATTYHLIDIALQNSHLSYYKWYYFSIITLTTVGYGDIIPINNLMKVLVSIEAFIGYISPSIIISIGVGLIFSENKI